MAVSIFQISNLIWIFFSNLWLFHKQVLKNMKNKNFVIFTKLGCNIYVFPKSLYPIFWYSVSKLSRFRISNLKTVQSEIGLDLMSVKFLMNKIWHINGFVTRVTRLIPLVEQELLTLLEHLRAPTIFVEL